jgi:signal peptidase II
LPQASEPIPAGDGKVQDALPRAAVPAPRFSSLALFWGLSLTVVALDQIAKALVRAHVPLYGTVTIVPGLLDIVHVHNAGVAFGLLNEVSHPERGLITSALAVAALAGIGYYARHITPEEWLARLGLSLILGGAIGNLTDRLWQGFVVDFVDVYWRGWHFWAFNVADSAITVGAIFVFIELLLPGRHASHSL